MGNVKNRVALRIRFSAAALLIILSGLQMCSKDGTTFHYAPTLTINGQTTHKIAKAWRIAIGDLNTNIQRHQSGMLVRPEPCILAGLFYDKPWTRDAAINVWSGAGLLYPGAAKNTLLAQVGRDDDDRLMIIGQYWDKIIWSIGAWQYYLYTRDKEFLAFSYQVTGNTLEKLERDEFDENDNLFRGPAVYGDGVAAYPAIYTTTEISGHENSYSGIDQWAAENPGKAAHPGYGMPMKALSTNCVYAEVYRLMALMSSELERSESGQWTEKFNRINKAVNKFFWNSSAGRYNYLIDEFGGCDYQESLGLAFAILFGIADSEQTQLIFEKVQVEPAGIPCVSPSFPRYKNTPEDYGRHSGTVWPHIQGFWAQACLENNQADGFLHEFNNLTKHAVRDNQFVEIYHPVTGLPYGGLQEPHGNTGHRSLQGHPGIHHGQRGATYSGHGRRSV